MKLHIYVDIFIESNLHTAFFVNCENTIQHPFSLFLSFNEYLFWKRLISHIISGACKTKCSALSEMYAVMQAVAPKRFAFCITSPWTMY